MYQHANDTNCTPCKKATAKKTERKLSFVGSLLVIIIPKCPFCIMAFSSAMTVCGGQSIYMENNNWVSFLPLVLSVIVVVMLIRNFRDFRTYIAIFMALTAIGMMLLSHQLLISESYFSVGSYLLVFAVWFNGSLFSLLNFITGKISNFSFAWQK